MCIKIVCKACSKATWGGCGFHIDSALEGVPMEDRCTNWGKGHFGRSNPPTPPPPIATDNLLENTDGVPRPPVLRGSGHPMRVLSGRQLAATV